MLQEGMKQSTIRRLTVGVVYGLLVSLIVSLPGPAIAQFIPIEQAKEQEQTKQDSQLSEILSEINSKGASARRQITALFDDVMSNKSTASNAERKSATVVDKLKSQLNTLLTDYTKKSPAPSGTSLRSAYDASQQILNDVRRQIDEGLDQAQLAKRENPNQLSGKYLKYQEKIKVIADKGLKKADDRLSERGTKDSVKRDLQQIITDTEGQIEIATTSFLSVNPELLASAVQRVKKGVLDELSEAMLARYKKAEERGTDKALDLSTQEQEELELFKKEMVNIVDRAIQTAEQLTQQIATANLPTSSELPGVNPLLEAKFKAEKQLKEILTSVGQRLTTTNSRYQSRTDVSALAKEVAARETDREKSRLTDTVNEYLDYFTAGDPTKKKYNNAKRDAQEEAQGCDSFLCDVGRAVSGVARGVIYSSTKVDIGQAGQGVISNGIFGIDDPNPYARSRYQTGSPRYTTIPGGATASGSLQYDPTRCLTDAVPTQGDKKFAFIETAKAEDKAPTFLEGESLLGDDTGDAPASRYFQDDGSGFFDTKPPSSLTDPVSSFFNPKPATTPKPNPLTQFGIPFLGELLGRRTTTTASYQGQYPCNSYPNQAYSSPFGGTPVPRLLGYNTTNLQPGFNQSNWQPLMQSLFQLAAQKDPCYGQVIPYFTGGLTVGEHNMMAQYLAQKCNFYTMSSDNQYWMGPVTNDMRHLCAPEFIMSNPQMAQICAKAWIPRTGTPPFFPTSMNGGSSNVGMIGGVAGTNGSQVGGIGGFDGAGGSIPEALTFDVSGGGQSGGAAATTEYYYKQAIDKANQINTYIEKQGGFKRSLLSVRPCEHLAQLPTMLEELRSTAYLIANTTQQGLVQQFVADRYAQYRELCETSFFQASYD